MWLHKQRGVALPLSVMLVLVLSLLGTALWQYSMTDALHASRHEKSTQAYYIARSGAGALAEYIVGDPDNVEDMRVFVDSLINEESEPTTLGNGTFVLNLERNPNNESEIIIRSRGEVDGVASTVYLTLAEDIAPLSPTPLELFFQYAIYSFTDLTLGGNVKIYNYSDSSWGDVGAGQSIIVKGHGRGIGDKDEGVDLDLIPVNFPDDLEYRGDLEIAGGSHTIDSDGHYGSIKLTGGATLNLATGGQDNNLVIRAGSFEMSGNNTQVKVTGGGQVFFYVDDLYKHTSGTVNPWGTDGSGAAGPTPSQFILLGPKTVDFGGNATFVGYIYSFEETQGFGVAGTPNIYGAVIFGYGTDFGNATVYYVDPQDEGNLPIGELPGGDGNVSYTTGTWR